MINYLDLWAIGLIFYDLKDLHTVYFKKSNTELDSYVLYYDGFRRTYNSDLTLYPKHINITNKVVGVNLDLQLYSIALKKPIIIDPQLMFDIQLGFHPVNALQSLIQRNIERAD